MFGLRTNGNVDGVAPSRRTGRCEARVRGVDELREVVDVPDAFENPVLEPLEKALWRKMITEKVADPKKLKPQVVGNKRPGTKTTKKRKLSLCRLVALEGKTPGGRRATVSTKLPARSSSRE